MRCDIRRAGFIDDITAMHAVAYRFVKQTKLEEIQNCCQMKTLIGIISVVCRLVFAQKKKQNKAKPSTKTNPLRIKLQSTETELFPQSVTRAL